MNHRITTLPFHVFVTDKVLVFTMNKVASRYTDYLLQPFTNVYATQVRIDSIEFWSGDDEEDTKINFYNTNVSPRIAIEQRDIIDKELQSIVDKKCKKDIIFIIREPLDRLVTGCAQEFFSGLHEKTGAGFDFKLKMILRNFVGGEDLYRKIQTDYINFQSNAIYERLLDNEIEIIKKLFLEYCLAFSETEITHTGHTNRYIPYLYDLLHSNILDSNKVKVIDISKSKEILAKTLSNYYEVDIQSDEYNSNQWLSNSLYQITDDNDGFEKYAKSKIISLFESHLQTEIYFYNKFLKSSFIIKDTI